MSGSLIREQNWIVASSNTMRLKAFEKIPLSTIDMFTTYERITSSFNVLTCTYIRFCKETENAEIMANVIKDKTYFFSSYIGTVFILSINFPNYFAIETYVIIIIIIKYFSIAQFKYKLRSKNLQFYYKIRKI